MASAPDLPRELVYAIFLEAASVRLDIYLGRVIHLTLVSKAVYQWITPILYRTFQPSEAQMRWLRRMEKERIVPAGFSHTRHLWVVFKDKPSRRARARIQQNFDLLRRCCPHATHVAIGPQSARFLSLLTLPALKYLCIFELRFKSIEGHFANMTSQRSYPNIKHL